MTAITEQVLIPTPGAVQISVTSASNQVLQRKTRPLAIQTIIPVPQKNYHHPATAATIPVLQQKIQAIRQHI